MGKIVSSNLTDSTKNNLNGFIMKSNYEWYKRPKYYIKRNGIKIKIDWEYICIQESLRRLNGDYKNMIRIKNPMGYHIYCRKPKGFSREAVGPEGTPIVPYAFWQDTYNGQIIEHSPKLFGF